MNPNPEKIIFAPVCFARKIGEGVLWLTEKFVPPAPTKPEIGASITIYEGIEPDYPEAA